MNCPNGIDEDVMNKIYNSLVEKYNSSNKVIDENEKKEIIQIFQDFKIENYIKTSNGKINYDEFINLVCILVPYYNIQGGDGTNDIVEYEPVSYFKYDKKQFKYDVLAIGSFILSIIFIYLAYLNFVKFTPVKTLENINIKEILDISTLVKDYNELTFMKFVKSTLFNWSCNFTEQVKKQLQNDLLSAVTKIMNINTGEIEAKCYTDLGVSSNPYLDVFVKGIEYTVNSAKINTCARNVLITQTNVIMQQISFDIGNNFDKLDGAITYLKTSAFLGSASIGYLAVRLGIKKQPYSDVANSSNNLRLTKGGLRKTKKSKKNKMKKNKKSVRNQKKC